MKNLKTILIAAMIIITLASCENAEENELIVKNEATITVNDKELNGPIAFAIVDKTPVFPGCEGNQKQLKECMSSKITNIVSTNFNIKVADGLEGPVKIVSSFVIDKNGFIKDIKVDAPNKDLQAEAKRLILLFPEMEPGKHEGKKADVSYVLPIKFQIKE